MMSEFFHFQHTLNRLFNSCIKSYWYYISSSWNMKWVSNWSLQKKLPSKRPALLMLIIVIKTSWLLSLFINASDILLSMLFNLVLANITILLCLFFLFLVVFNSFFTILTETVNAARAPITVSNNAIEMLSVVTDKTINYLLK